MSHITTLLRVRKWCAFVRFSSQHLGKMSKKALVLLAPGAEEMEFVTPVDILRRGGVEVCVAGVVGAEPVRCRSDIQVVPDVALADAVGPFDAVVLPGGALAAKTLCESQAVGDLLKNQEQNGQLIAAICAGPTALKAHGIGVGCEVTSYPSTADVMRADGLYKYVADKAVVTDKHVITSRGPATALPFALAILEQLVGRDKAVEVAKAVLFDY